MHEWMADNGHTPHIVVVDASVSTVFAVPPEHVKGRTYHSEYQRTPLQHNLKLV